MLTELLTALCGPDDLLRFLGARRRRMTTRLPRDAVTSYSPTQAAWTIALKRPSVGRAPNGPTVMASSWR